MGELRQLMTEGFIKLDLPGCVGQMIVAADDMGDTHVDVVDHHAKIIRRRAVGTGDDQVIKLAIVENDVAFDQIFDDGGAVARRTKTNGKRLVRRQRWDHAFRRATGAVVGGFAFFLLRQLPFGVQFCRRAGAGIGFTLG